MNESINLNKLDFYSFFTKYSLMDEYGFSYGLLSRMIRKVLPTVSSSNTIEYYLLNQDISIPDLILQLDSTLLGQSNVPQQLNLSIKALCTKVIAFGLDNNLESKFKYLGLDDKVFAVLLENVAAISDFSSADLEDIKISLKRIEHLILKLRQNKNKIGTNFHLTLLTRRILEYIARIEVLLNLSKNISSKKLWNEIFCDYRNYSNSKNSLRKYLNRHSDLVALEIVEHTSYKGQKYIAENRKEYKSFFVRSLLGGGIIAVFAFIKILMDSYQLSSISNAFMFSLNYALCFIVVKQFNGIIATKQPSMTASTIAKHIDRQDKLVIDSNMSIVTLVRKVFRSQLISIIGNYLMSLLVASLLLFSMNSLKFINITNVVKPDYLIQSVLPSFQLIIYAMIAGFFLALSGLISGYVDNKLVFSKIPYRIRHSKFFSFSSRFASYIDNKAGALSGNIVLGFFLGSAFLFSSILPFSVDIRHIAFSAANVGYAMVSHKYDVTTILMALLGVSLIGFTNFLVSFSITLYLALKSRGANFSIIPNLIKSILIDFLKNPLLYLFKTSDTK